MKNLGHFKDNSYADFTEAALDHYDFKVCKKPNGKHYGVPDDHSCQKPNVEVTKRPDEGLFGLGKGNQINYDTAKAQGDAKTKAASHTPSADKLSRYSQKELEAAFAKLKNAPATPEMGRVAARIYSELSKTASSTKLPDVRQSLPRPLKMDVVAAFFDESIKAKSQGKTSKLVERMTQLRDKAEKEVLALNHRDDAGKHNSRIAALTAMDMMKEIGFFTNDGGASYKKGRENARSKDFNENAVGPNFDKIVNAVKKTPSSGNLEKEQAKKRASESKASSPKSSSSGGAKMMSSSDTKSQYASFYRMARANGQGHMDAVETAKGMLDVSERTNGVRWDRSGLTGAYRSEVRRSYE